MTAQIAANTTLLMSSSTAYPNTLLITRLPSIAAIVDGSTRARPPIGDSACSTSRPRAGKERRFRFTTRSFVTMVRGSRPRQKQGSRVMKLAPYLFFDGRAEEAIEFYGRVLG